MNDTWLVRHILKEGGIAPADLAAQLGIKDRAMRDRIRRANEAMRGAGLIVYDRSRGAYVVDVSDRRALDAWFERPRPADAPGRLPATPDERVLYLLQDLLSRSDWTTLEDLARLLFVSRSTVSGDLRALSCVLSRFGLSIEKRPRYGIRVVGQEMNRRLCLASAAIDARPSDDDLAGAVSPTALDAVGRCVSEALVHEGFKVNPVSRQNLVVHIAIAIARIKKGCSVPMEAVNSGHVRESPEYAVAASVARAIEERFAVGLPEEEVAYIAIHLAGKHLVEELASAPRTEGGAPGAEGASTLEISDEAWNLAGEMVEVVLRAFRFDLRGDTELRMNLARHIMPLLVRLRYGMAFPNPLLSEIKACYPLPFSMAADALSIIAERLSADISDDEIGYVALIFALSLERSKTGRPGKRVLVVCASGAGSARLLAYRLEEEFGRDFESIETCDVSEFNRMDLSDVDYIFTTVPLPCHADIPVVHISLFFDDESHRGVRRALRREGAVTARTCFFPELFFPSLSLGTREEVIAFLCERCRAFAGLPDSFEGLVWERERAAATSFGNLVAFPHPFEAVSPRTFAAVALLDEPVDWDGRPVQVVFMVCIARDAGADLEAFYRSMAGVLTRRQSIRRLVGDRRFEVLLSEVEGG